jgi:hypothetical protein
MRRPEVRLGPQHSTRVRTRATLRRTRLGGWWAKGAAMEGGKPEVAAPAFSSLAGFLSFRGTPPSVPRGERSVRAVLTRGPDRRRVYRARATRAGVQLEKHHGGVRSRLGPTLLGDSPWTSGRPRRACTLLAGARKPFSDAVSRAVVRFCTQHGGEQRPPLRVTNPQAAMSSRPHDRLYPDISD